MKRTLKKPLDKLDMAGYAIWRQNSSLFDVLYEHGASLDYDESSKTVKEVMSGRNEHIKEVQFKHARWRRLRQLLNL